MTNAELIAKIKAEVERLENYYTSVEWYVEALLSFLSTLESEKPMNQKGLEREIERCLWKLSDDPSNEELRMFARHFAEWQKEQMMKEEVEGVIDDCGTPVRLSLKTHHESFRIGDKIHIIIVKEEKE